MTIYVKVENREMLKRDLQRFTFLYSIFHYIHVVFMKLYI